MARRVRVQISKGLRDFLSVGAGAIAQGMSDPKKGDRFYKGASVVLNGLSEGFEIEAGNDPVPRQLKRKAGT